ncbi:MAG: 3-oxoacyl-ACP synthase, partial [Desulfobulbus sp.]|nr:3-oxoacyl-ACP synthase [Desulfobulbus sp.]
MKRRVVITACSAITPIGYGKEAIVDSLRQGRSGVKPLRDDGLLAGHIHSRVFGTVDYPIAYEFSRSQRKTMGPVAYYACQATKDVLAASGLSREFIESGRLGVAFGSTHGSPTVQREIYKTFFQHLDTEFSSIGA